ASLSRELQSEPARAPGDEDGTAPKVEARKPPAERTTASGGERAGERPHLRVTRYLLQRRGGSCATPRRSNGIHGHHASAFHACSPFSQTSIKTRPDDCSARLLALKGRGGLRDPHDPRAQCFVVVS